MASAPELPDAPAPAPEAPRKRAGESGSTSASRAAAAAAASSSGLRRDPERDRRFFAGLGRLVRGIAGAVLVPALLAFVWTFAAWIYELPAKLAATPTLVILGWLIVRVVRAAAGALFGPPELRLVPCDDATARRFRIALRILGGLVGAFAAVVAPLDVLGYPQGAVNALALAIKFLTIVTLAVVLARRGLLGALLPAGDTPLRRTLARLAGVLYVFGATYVLALLVIDGLGYLSLARYLGQASALSAAIITAMYVARKYMSLRLDLWLEAGTGRLKGDDSDEGRAELGYRRELARGGEALGRLTLWTTAAVLLLFAWGLDARGVREQLSQAKLLSWIDAGLRLGITALDVILAAYAVLVGYFGGRIAQHKLWRRLGASGTLDRGTQTALSSVLFMALFGIGLYVAVGRLHVNLDALKWLGGAIGLGLGFGLQNIVNNFVSGVILIVEKRVKTDDIVQIEGGAVGRVMEIGTRSTVVLDADNVSRIVPNADLVTKQVVNWTHEDPLKRIHVRVSLPPGSDVQRLRGVMLECAGNHGLVLKKPPPDVFFDDIGREALELCLVAFIDDPWRERRIRSDLRFAIDAAIRKLTTPEEKTDG